MPDVSRRRFLRDSSVTAAAVGLGFLGRGTARGALGPNDTVRVGVVGVRVEGRGWAHIQSLKALPNVQVAALCDVDERELRRTLKRLTEPRAPAAAAKGEAEAKPEPAKLEAKTPEAVTPEIGKPALYTDVRKLLDDPSIDAVSIATPNHWHSLASIWACQAGKDVYVEKPCSHNLSEGRRLVEAARKHQRIVQHGTQCRSHSGIREAMEQLKNGVIGDVYMARGLCYKWRNTIGKAKEEPAPEGVHYDLWLGPAPVRPYSRNRFHYNWHWHWDYGNGDIGNQGVHQMDLARWALGVGLPRRVQSMGGHYLFDDDQETPNTQIATFEYPEEKKMLVFEVRHWITNTEGDAPCDIGVLIYGSEGYMVIPSYSGYATFLGKKREPGPKGQGGGNHFENFIQAVRSRKRETLNAEIEEGHLSSALCHLANMAYRLGRTIDFDPKTESCLNDDKASALLTREYRKPFVVPESVASL